MVNRIDHANAVKVDHTIDPDNVQRPRQIALTNANGSWTYGTYAYDGAGNIKTIGSDTYIYDKVSRLTSGSLATATCGSKSQTASYNPFGFMTSTTTTDWGTQNFLELSSGLYNRISGVGYDAAGNTTSWGTHSYTWNRLNQMLTANSGANHTFFYTADGERVSDRVGTNKTITIRDLGNKVLRVYAYNGASWSWSKDYVYRQGQLLATVEPPFASQVTKHFHLDHLGSPRRVTDASRNIIATHDHYPFGLEACGTSDWERMKLTGHERDLQGTIAQTDDLDYMHARYYNPNIARFLSVDFGATNSQSPQGWNRLAYVLGSPGTLVDPEGMAARVSYLIAGTDPAAHAMVRIWDDENPRVDRVYSAYSETLSTDFGFERGPTRLMALDEVAAEYARHGLTVAEYRQGLSTDEATRIAAAIDSVYGSTTSYSLGDPSWKFGVASCTTAASQAIEPNLDLLHRTQPLVGNPLSYFIPNYLAPSFWYLVSLRTRGLVREELQVRPKLPTSVVFVQEGVVRVNGKLMFVPPS